MKLSKKITVGLVCGGKSLEHEVDLFPSKDLYSAFDTDKYDVVILGIDKSGNWRFSRESDYLLFPGNDIQTALNLSKSVVYPTSQGRLIDRETHGCLAEIDVFFPITDDPIQSFFNLLDVPYIGSDVFGFVIGRDKDVTNRLLRDSGFSAASYIILRSDQTISFEEAVSQLGLPLFIKPCRLGSSIGVFKISDEAGFHQALQEAFRYDRKILLEQAIEGREIGCAVLGNENPEAALALVEIINLKEFFTFEAKYAPGKEGHLKIPAELDESVAQKIREAAVFAFKLLECEGMARIDFFLKPDGSFLIHEVNTSPGMGKNFMYPKMWQVSGVPYHELLDRLIQLAMDRHRQEKKLKTSFEL